MDLGSLFFSPNGRIGRKDFWIGFLILFAFGLLLHAVVVIGSLIWLYIRYCLYAKRLHDLGRSGTVLIWAIVLDIVAVATLIALGVGALISAIFSHGGATLGYFAGSLGLMALAGFIWFFIHLVFVLWVGLSRGQDGDNRYGPQPLR